MNNSIEENALVSNILTIDVEDWYMDTHISTWDLYEDRIFIGLNKILEKLNSKNMQATFFVVAYLAERFPDLVKEIKDNGHEIASHGYNHIPITRQTSFEFEEDLFKSVCILKKITGDNVIGYRASNFSVVDRTSWAIDILKKHGIKYDSSIFPVKTHLYGVPDAPLFPYFISSKNIKNIDVEGPVFELPLSVYKCPLINKNVPIAGGFYLRFFPYCFINHAIKKINKLGQPAIIYIHPWELDPYQPRIKNLKWYHYYNIKNLERNFERLLNDFKFTSVKEYFGNF